MVKQHRKEKSIWPSFNLLRETDKARLAADAEAKLRSESIDRALEDEREQLSREPKAKILLLGPSESGKSTIVKGLRMAFSPTAFQAQMDAWLPIIQLNLVRTLNAIVEALDILKDSYGAHLDGQEDPLPPSTDTIPPDSDEVPSEVHGLASRLKRLRFVERDLELEVHDSEPSSVLSSPAITRPSTPVPSSTSHTVSERHEASLRRRDISRRASEISMRPGILKQRLLDHSSDTPSANSSHHQLGPLLAECAADMQALWEHPWVRKSLEEREIFLEYQSGFFLNDIPRLTSRGYRPTADDVLRARVHTPSAEEHRLMMETQPFTRAREWIIYDVGGRRSQRAAWAQYFDDVTAVLYVASLSAFNETLAEDTSINRLTDTLLLWQKLCSNRLLASVDFVLLLNKTDLLKSKLEGGENRPGLKFVDYVNSFKSRPNDADTVTKYIREMFLSLHRQHSPTSRRVYCHLTCAIDSQKVQPVLNSIRDLIATRISTEPLNGGKQELM